MVCSNVHRKDERKRKVVCYRCTEWCFREKDEMSELRGVMYMMKRRGQKHAKTDVERRETTFTFNIKTTRGQIRFETVKDSANY